MAESISFPQQVSEVVIKQTEKISMSGGIEIRLSKSSGLLPFLRQKQMQRRSCRAHFTGCIFHQWVSDGVLISVRLFSSRSLCTSFNLHSVDQETVNSSACLPLLPQPKPLVSQCENCHSCTFICSGRLQSQRDPAGEARASVVLQSHSSNLNLTKYHLILCVAGLVTIPTW